MRIVLHIGTHKTGTSALQAFCAKNRDALLARGIYYPKLENGSNSFNFLGAQLAFGKHDEVRRFFDRALRDTRKAGANTLLVSGESLYAMTSLFYRLYERPCGEYWGYERSLVRALRACLPANATFSVYCYVRRQDRFIESLYNQCVKHPAGFGGDINEFLGQMHETVYYARQLQLWADSFGSNALKVRSYEKAASRLPTDFLCWALGISDFSDFSQLRAPVNERLARDLLEYKRILNRMRLSRADGISASVHIVELSQAGGDDGRYQDYLGSTGRAALLSAVSDDWGSLTLSYPELLLSAAVDSDAMSKESRFYDGLSAAAVVEIAYRHWLLYRQPRIWIRTWLRRIYEPLRLRSRTAAWIIARVGNLLRKRV